MIREIDPRPHLLRPVGEPVQITWDGLQRRKRIERAVKVAAAILVVLVVALCMALL